MFATSALSFENTIIAGGIADVGAAKGNCAYNTGDAPVSKGHNLEDANTCNLTAAGDQINTNPMLGPLQNNGGQTDTEAPLPGSPAIDVVPAADCPTTDQVGDPRPAAGQSKCDVGAYEPGSPSSTTTTSTTTSSPTTATTSSSGNISSAGATTTSGTSATTTSATSATTTGSGAAANATTTTTSTTSTGGGGGEASSGSGGSPRTAQAALACTTAQIVLIDVTPEHGQVLITGAARGRLIGKQVKIEFLASHKAVATTTIAANGTFSATAPLPPKDIRDSNRARYQAVVGRQKSSALKLSRRAELLVATLSGSTVHLQGAVSGSFRTGAKVVITLRVTCSSYRVVAKTKLTRSGRFSATFAAPSGAAAQIAVYRAQTTVLSGSHPEKTFTLPQPVTG